MGRLYCLQRYAFSPNPPNKLGKIVIKHTNFVLWDAVSKVLSLENEKKNVFFFCILLTYLYL